MNNISNNKTTIEIKNKEINNKLWNKGVLGNKLRSWNSYDELISSGYKGTVSIRYLEASQGGGGRYRYEVPILEIQNVIKEWIDNSAIESKIFFNESAPDSCLLIQGELMYDVVKNVNDNGTCGYNLFYCKIPGKMRDVLFKYGSSAEGLYAKILLQHYMDAYSFEDICLLLEKYPGHVIEFSTYGINLGNIPGRNTIIWEVRKY